jgi:hypothetical protein
VALAVAFSALARISYGRQFCWMTFQFDTAPISFLKMRLPLVVEPDSIVFCVVVSLALFIADS